MRSRRMAVVADVARSAAAFALIWLLLTGFDRQALAFGAVATAAALALSLYLRPPPRPHPPLVPAVVFLALLLRGVVAGGYDVARRAVLPRRKIADPGYLRQRVEGAEEMGLLALSYARTLSPGTAAARTEEEGIELHSLAPERAESSGRLERAVRDIGRRLDERRAAWKR